MKQVVKETLPYILTIMAVLIVKSYIVSPIKVNGPSMYPTLQDKDIMLLSKISYRIHGIKRFDIVVIHEGKDFIIKRVIGLPGDKVEYKDNKLYINGKYVKENFEHQKTNNFETIKKVPEGMFFVLGDNRKNSTDSRILGFIPVQDILGHATYTIYPFNRLGLKK